MQKPSTQGVGGAAVHVVPPAAEDESLIGLATMLGFEIGDDNGSYWMPLNFRLRTELGLTDVGEAPTKTQAARDALAAMADAINERLRR